MSSHHTTPTCFQNVWSSEDILDIGVVPVDMTDETIIIYLGIPGMEKYIRSLSLLISYLPLFSLLCNKGTKKKDNVFLQVRSPCMLPGSNGPGFISPGLSCVLGSLAAAVSVHVQGLYQCQRQGKQHMLSSPIQNTFFKPQTFSITVSLWVVPHNVWLTNSVELCLMDSCPRGWYQPFRTWTSAAWPPRSCLPSVVCYLS